jgi:hypothetical protein
VGLREIAVSNAKTLDSQRIAAMRQLESLVPDWRMLALVCERLEHRIKPGQGGIGAFFLLVAELVLNFWAVMTTETDSPLCHCGLSLLGHTLDQSTACGLNPPLGADETLNLACDCGKRIREHSRMQLHECMQVRKRVFRHKD